MENATHGSKDKSLKSGQGISKIQLKADVERPGAGCKTQLVEKQFIGEVLNIQKQFASFQQVVFSINAQQGICSQWCRWPTVYRLERFSGQTPLCRNQQALRNAVCRRKVQTMTRPAEKIIERCVFPGIGFR
jgi:hypothetical protein